MLAELRNSRTRFLVGSIDWQSITGRLGGHWRDTDDRWDESRLAWRWTAEEALFSLIDLRKSDQMRVMVSLQ